MNQEYKNFLSTARKKPISEHFTLFEVCNSDTALRLNIDNRPTPQVVVNATATIKNVLEKVRTHFNAPVIVHCMYRCPALNKKVGGVMPEPSKNIKGSQHLYGQAADFHVEGHTIQEVFDYIKNNIIFDQVIQEGTWVHVSFRFTPANRREALIYKNGKYING